MSVYNGFDSLIKSMMGNVEPDLMITPATGKVFVPEGEVYDWIYDQEAVVNMSCVLQEQVFISYDGKQGLAKARGVDWIYEEETPLREHLVEGEFRLHKGDIPLAAVGASLAYELSLSPRFLAPIEIYFPSRDRKISTSNPFASLESIKVWPSCTFAVNADIDSELIILPIEKMRELLEYDDEVSAIELRLAPGTGEKEVARLQEDISARLGSGFNVKDRFQQNEALYKMMKYEKAAIYMILLFVIIIIAFNIFGSLSMLIIEKKSDIETLRSLGAQDSLIRKIFVLEGWLISLIGMGSGLVIGVAFALMQQHFGFIKMPGHFTVQAYPIIISFSDILLTMAGVAVIGYIIALLPTASLSRKTRS
jgi:ABC-type lipoprotein release transport system permease subunit